MANGWGPVISWRRQRHRSAVRVGGALAVVEDVDAAPGATWDVHVKLPEGGILSGRCRGGQFAGERAAEAVLRAATVELGEARGRLVRVLEAAAAARR